MKSALLIAVACASVLALIGVAGLATAPAGTPAGAPADQPASAAPVAPPAATAAAPAGKHSDRYYTQIYTYQLFVDTDTDLMFQNHSVKNFVAIVGPTPTDDTHVWNVRSSKSVYLEEPYVYFSGRRYMVMRGKIDDPARYGQATDFVRIIDLDQTVAEAKFRDAIENACGISGLPKLDTANAGEEELKSWVAQVQKQITDKGVSLKDVAGRLGRPTYMHYEKPSTAPLKASLSYCLRGNVKVARQVNERKFSYPMFEFTVEGDKAVKLEYHIASDESFGPGHIIF